MPSFDLEDFVCVDRVNLTSSYSGAHLVFFGVDSDGKILVNNSTIYEKDLILDVNTLIEKFLNKMVKEHRVYFYLS